MSFSLRLNGTPAIDHLRHQNLPTPLFVIIDYMKITKFVHACLIAERNGKRILVDPGSYSWQSGLIKDSLLQKIDSVIVTHAHPDHLHEDFVRAVVANSPDATWYGPEEVVEILQKWGVEASAHSDDSNIRFIKSEHADLSPWFSVQPEHTSFVILDELLIGGDCHTLTESYGARIFGGAINGGPWGAVVGFSKMIEAMQSRPEIVIPLHDWHLNDEARAGIYANLPEVMGKLDVKFVPLENAVSKEI